MCINHRSEQLPGPSPAVHTHHAQDLEETKATQCRGSKDIALATGWNHGNRGDEHNDVCEAEGWLPWVTRSKVWATGHFHSTCPARWNVSHIHTIWLTCPSRKQPTQSIWEGEGPKKESWKVIGWMFCLSHSKQTQIFFYTLWPSSQLDPTCSYRLPFITELWLVRPYSDQVTTKQMGACQYGSVRFQTSNFRYPDHLQG